MSSASRHKYKRSESPGEDKDDDRTQSKERIRNRSRSRSPLPDSREPESIKSSSSVATKSAIQLAQKQPLKPNGIKLRLSSSNASPLNPIRKPETKKFSVAKAFCTDDSDEEEMPAECKMRMRNIGRNTPTSSGPNSFGKTKNGFCDQKKIFEKLSKGPGEDD